MIQKIDKNPRDHGPWQFGFTWFRSLQNDLVLEAAFKFNGMLRVDKGAWFCYCDVKLTLIISGDAGLIVISRTYPCEVNDKWDVSIFLQDTNRESGLIWVVQTSGPQAFSG